MNKPLIALTTSYNGTTMALKQPYFDAIYDAGGIPVPLAETEDGERLASYAETFDGFLFTGGVDVAPSYYGEEVTGANVEIDEARDRFEFALYEKVFALQKPIFGICRGIQFLNVARGGSLHQDIPGHHQSTKVSVHEQHVRVLTGSRLRTLTGKPELLVNSFHHQSVKEVASGLLASAVADDGTVEAVEDLTYPFFLAVQWHPEHLYRLDPDARALFAAFVDSCKH